MKKGDKALVHAAAGGAGQLIVQMAKMLGATVYGTAGTDEKVKIAKEAGADEAIVYTREDFVTEIKHFTGGKGGVDVVYDSVGATTFLKGLDIIRPRGLMALFGASSGPVGAVRCGTAESERLALSDPAQPFHHVAPPRKKLAMARRRCAGVDRRWKTEVENRQGAIRSPMLPKHTALWKRAGLTGKLLLIP